MTNHDPDCLFCKIIQGQITAAILHQDEQVTAFRDINPQAPVHFLVVPNAHIATTGDLTPENEAIVGTMIRLAHQIALKEGVTNGYRLTFNNGQDGNQTVKHLHMHLLGGRRLAWPPG